MNHSVLQIFNNNNSGNELDGDNIGSRFESQSRFYQHFCPITFHMCQAVSLVLVLCGLPGNTLSFIVWASGARRNQSLLGNRTSLIILAGLALSHLLLLPLYMVTNVENYWNVHTLHSSTNWLYNLLFYSFQFMSLPLILAFTLDRWLAICYPFSASFRHIQSHLSLIHI